MLQSFDGRSPSVGQGVFLAPDCWILGDVHLADGASVFFGAVLRGDLMPIHVGQNSNIQDHVIIHTSNERVPVTIGEGVSIGHRAILHGCSIASHSLVGMGACILDEAQIGEECLIGAHTLITEGSQIPPRSLVVGSPGRVVRQLRSEEIESIRATAARYSRIAALYVKSFEGNSVD